MCRGNYSFHVYDPPLLYNLHTDPGEIYALDSKSTEYANVMEEIQKVSTNTYIYYDMGIPYIMKFYIEIDQSMKVCH